MNEGKFGRLYFVCYIALLVYFGQFLSLFQGEVGYEGWVQLNNRN